MINAALTKRKFIGLRNKKREITIGNSKVIRRNWGMIFEKRISIDCRNTTNKVDASTSQNQQKYPVTRSRFKLKVKTSKLHEGRENAGDQGLIGLSFAFDWLKWHQIM